MYVSSSPALLFYPMQCRLGMGPCRPFSGTHPTGTSRCRRAFSACGVRTEAGLAWGELPLARTSDTQLHCHSIDYVT